MKINNKNINNFNASIKSFDMSTLGIDNNIMLLDSGYLPILREQKLSAQERTLILDFIHEDDISNFTAECSRESILNLDDGYEYLCYLKATPTIQTEGIAAYTVEYPMYVIKRKPMIMTQIREFIFIEGNVNTSCIFEITAATDLKTYQINNFTINNLKANETFYLDGIHKLIYRSSTPDQSAFDDVTLSSFPMLKPGNQYFNTSDDTVKVILKYYPTYM